MKTCKCGRCGEPFDVGGVYTAIITKEPFDVEPNGFMHYNDRYSEILESCTLCENCMQTIKEVLFDGGIN